MVFRNSLPIWWLWTRCLWNIFLHEQWSVRNKPVVFVLLPQCVITRCKSCNFLFCVSVCLQGPVRKSLSRVDKQMRRFADIRRLTKTGHAVKISVEGNRMPLWFFFSFFFFCSKLSRIYRFYFLLFCFWTNPQLCPPQVQLCLTEKRGCCQTVLASVQMCYLL